MGFRLGLGTYNGFGTTLYGERDYLPDGSYITTKWIVFMWVPLIPIRSLRVKWKGMDTTGGGVSEITTEEYIVYSTQRPSLKQVLSVYMFLAGLLIIGSTAAYVGATIGESLAGLLAILSMVAWCLLPFWLRRRAELKVFGTTKP